ncbi:MAG: hypothetical protein HYY01_07480 [Chloroflexi bacterium]|nr:hypothetical protein [Chloroflexota bacterium]
MPRASAWFVRSAFLYLLVGFSLGALLLFYKGTGFLPQVWRLLPAHAEVLLMAWLVQLAMGVGYWILPRPGGKRGGAALVWVVFGVFNAGVWLAVAGQVMGLPLLTWLGRLGELVAVVLFVAHAWRRLRV